MRRLQCDHFNPVQLLKSCHNVTDVSPPEGRPRLARSLALGRADGRLFPGLQSTPPPSIRASSPRSIVGPPPPPPPPITCAFENKPGRAAVTHLDAERRAALEELLYVAQALAVVLRFLVNLERRRRRLEAKRLVHAARVSWLFSFLFFRTAGFACEFIRNKTLYVVSRRALHRVRAGRTLREVDPAAGRRRRLWGRRRGK